jgi:hypothetical protein
MKGNLKGESRIMKASWVKPDSRKIKNEPPDRYDKIFKMLKVRSDSMKRKFRKLGAAIVEGDQEAVNEIIKYFNEHSSSKMTAEQIDGLKFLVETAERGPQEMAHRQIFEQYFPKPDLSNVKKVPTDIFHWRDSQGLNRNKKHEYRKPSNGQIDRGLFGKLA